MNAIREVYAFVTGGSAVTPFGLVLAIVAARFGAGAFLGVLILTFVASTLERAA